MNENEITYKKNATNKQHLLMKALSIDIQFTMLNQRSVVY